MDPESNFYRLCKKFEVNNITQHMELRDDLLCAVWRLKDTVNDDVYRAFVCMHAGGEFQQDAAIEAVINGWRRDASGKLPVCEAKRLCNPRWFEHNAPDANNVAMNALADAVEKLRSARLEDAKLAKAKRMLSKRLHDEGYRKMWVRVNTGMLGVSDIDIIEDGQRITYAGAQMTGAIRL